MSKDNSSGRAFLYTRYNEGDPEDLWVTATKRRLARYNTVETYSDVGDKSCADLIRLVSKAGPGDMILISPRNLDKFGPQMHQYVDNRLMRTGASVLDINEDEMAK